MNFKFLGNRRRKRGKKEAQHVRLTWMAEIGGKKAKESMKMSLKAKLAISILVTDRFFSCDTATLTTNNTLHNMPPSTTNPYAKKMTTWPAFDCSNIAVKNWLINSTANRHFPFIRRFPIFRKYYLRIAVLDFVSRFYIPVHRCVARLLSVSV